MNESEARVLAASSFHSNRVIADARAIEVAGAGWAVGFAVIPGLSKAELRQFLRPFVKDGDLKVLIEDPQPGVPARVVVVAPQPTLEAYAALPQNPSD